MVGSATISTLSGLSVNPLSVVVFFAESNTEIDMS